MQEWLRKDWFRRTVYMVTAIKIANNASLTRQTSEVQAVGVNVEGGGGGHGVEAGCTVQREREVYSIAGESFMAEEDFVYAFQVRKCHFGGRGV